jgi:hypothetical protein
MEESKRERKPGSLGLFEKAQRLEVTQFPLTHKLERATPI